MSCYLRRKIPGATYFFTLRLAAGGSDLLVQNIDALRAAYLETVREWPVYCDAMVVLPDHLHAIWTLPAQCAEFSERWRKIKFRFSQSVHQPDIVSPSKRRKREKGIWQRRFWEHHIRDPQEYHRYMSYCWQDPVGHGLVKQASQWPYSTIHRDIRMGRIDATWSAPPIHGQFGE